MKDVFWFMEVYVRWSTYQVHFIQSSKNIRIAIVSYFSFNNSLYYRKL